MFHSFRVVDDKHGWAGLECSPYAISVTLLFFPSGFINPRQTNYLLWLISLDQSLLFLQFSSDCKLCLSCWTEGMQLEAWLGCCWPTLLWVQHSQHNDRMWYHTKLKPGDDTHKWTWVKWTVYEVSHKAQNQWRSTLCVFVFIYLYRSKFLHTGAYTQIIGEEKNTYIHVYIHVHPSIQANIVNTISQEHF